MPAIGAAGHRFNVSLGSDGNIGLIRPLLQSYYDLVGFAGGLFYRRVRGVFLFGGENCATSALTTVC